MYIYDVGGILHLDKESLSLPSAYASLEISFSGLQIAWISLPAPGSL